jgi:hypothetical protein
MKTVVPLFSLFIYILIFLSPPSRAAIGAPLGTEEKLLDFRVAIDQFEQYYAPLKYKEKRLGVNYKHLFNKLRKEVLQTKSDHEFYQTLGKLVRSFDDGHVSVHIPGMDSYSLPFTVDYFEGHFVVVNVDKDFSEQTGIALGDQLLSIDGMSPDIVSSMALRYRSLGYKRSNRRLGAFRVTHRDFLRPPSRRAYLKLQRYSDGAEYYITTYWNKNTESPSYPESENLLTPSKLKIASTNIGIPEFGAYSPFFYTAEAQSTFGFAKVQVTIEQWLMEGEEGVPHDVFALLYRYSGANILLIRIPTYDVQDTQRAVKTYEILLKTYEHLADVLVIDQTHNPGGDVEYVEELSRLFMKKPGPSFAFAPRADREWLRTFSTIWKDPNLSHSDRIHYENIYMEIEEAQRRGDFLSPPIALTRRTTTMQENNVWSKPVLLLIDELCGSGGDGFPMIMKGNEAATLFGHRTSGMGGNVDSIGNLPSTGAKFQLTRSLFYLATKDDSLPDNAIIENNGVEPHIKRDYGIDDFYNRYIEYIKDFSQAAVDLE